MQEEHKSDNTYMTDVPLYTAVISASAAVFGAAIPTIGIAMQSVLQARRDRRERYESAKREACVELMQAVENLRTQVANNHDYHGDEMGARLAQVRSYAAQARVESVRISLLVPPELAEIAQQLATAASRLEQAAVNTTNLRQGTSTELPDFAELSARIAAFKAEAVNNAAGEQGTDDGNGTRPVGGAAETKGLG